MNRQWTASSSFENKAKTSVGGRMLEIAVPIIWLAMCFSAHTVYTGIRNTLDDFGWIRHSHDTRVWIGGGWLVGEYRMCQMPLLWGHRLPASAHLLCGLDTGQDLENPWSTEFMSSTSDHEFYGLMGNNWTPVDHLFHILPVNYWGKIDRTGDSFVTFTWRCQRLTSGLECKAIN
jgi:hypothetical protein